MANLYRLLASVPRGFADLLAIELEKLGAKDIRERGNAVQFTGDLQVAYRACLESWLASRIYLEIARFEAVDAEGFYASVRSIDWSQHIDPDRTLACEFTGQHPAINNSHFAVLRIKDAICDNLRERCGRRPSIAASEPAVRIHVHAAGAQLTVSVDLAGESLHRRGWRSDSGAAPLRENVAAGILQRAAWPQIAAEGGRLLDPLCGVGTFVIEAARMAKGEAANARRDYFGFLGWRGHDSGLWSALCAAAAERAADIELSARSEASGLRRVAIGRDRDRKRIAASWDHARRAGVEDWVHFEAGDLAETRLSGSGLICTNPPWGLRLEDQEGARQIHRDLGQLLRDHFKDWQAAVLTGDASLGLELGMRARRAHTVFNGSIECRLLRFDLATSASRDLRPTKTPYPRIDLSLLGTPGAQMFANRLRKNQKQLSSWLRRDEVSCYRLYDADMPEYAFAIDVYDGVIEEVTEEVAETATHPMPTPIAERWLMVQEYAAPPQIPDETLRKRRHEALAGLVEATGVPAERVRLRTRHRRRRGEQYERSEITPTILVIKENKIAFKVNLGAYLDTGIFLDHRPVRQRLFDLASGQRFLNLFAYTGVASVYAAVGGAKSTTSVDLSATYLDWAATNFHLNGLSAERWDPPPFGRTPKPSHALIQANVLSWLPQTAAIGDQYDLIFCDPPTFSNSKRMEGVLDVQRDHVALIENCLKLLAPKGLLIFSTNAQRFTLDDGLRHRYRIIDHTRKSIPVDFLRNPRIHQCFDIRHG